jgi:di/tricarboxylate transporter
VKAAVAVRFKANVLRDATGAGFAFFDFAWIGLPILVAGTMFVALVGRHLLPRTDTTRAPEGQRDDEALEALRKLPEFESVARVSEDEQREGWRLDERLFVLRVPEASALAGTTLGENHIGDAFDFRLMAPIALSTAADLGISPLAPVMAIAIAATSLASPVAHPANVMVMGPGGYRFADYLKIGLPLTLVVFVAALLLLPWVWPL